MKSAGERPRAGSAFLDDDPFLLKFLPGASRAMRQLRTQVHRLNTNLGLARFVLLIGETGTGKNHVARVMAGHRQWLAIRDDAGALDPGRGLPDGIAPLADYTTRLGEVVLSVVTETLAASELFGHVRGAFSDARRDHPGLFGDDGYDDILLDEIGEATPGLQAKLLGVLEGREFVPVGGTSAHRRQLKPRILMATNRDLTRMVRDGSFREDLLSRIRRHIVHVPPLRAHLDDLPGIASAIIERLCSRDPARAHRPRPALTSRDLEWARGQQWRANIRELEEVLEQWLLVGAEEPLESVAGRREYSDAGAGTGHVADIRARVRHEIEEILADRKPSPGTFSKFVDSFTRDVDGAVTRAVVEWYRERRPDEATVKRLFRDMTWESIKTALSRAARR